MSSAGRAANSNGCVSKPKEHATGLIGFAAQIRRSSLIGSCAMETAEHREPCESRGSRTDLGAPGGEIPPGDSTSADRCQDRQAARVAMAGGLKKRERASPLSFWLSVCYLTALGGKTHRGFPTDETLTSASGRFEQVFLSP